MVKVNELKIKECGYIEQLYRDEKRGCYWRIVRTAKGNWFDVYKNESEYGEKKYDVEADIGNRTFRAATIKEFKQYAFMLK